MSKESNLQKLSSSHGKIHQTDEKSNRNDAVKKKKNREENERKKNMLILTNDSFFDKYSKYIPWIILILTVIVYSNSINNGFLNWDDDRYVTGNPYLLLSWHNIKYFFSHFYFVMYIPLSMVSYMFDYHIVALSQPWVYHLHNLILHLINTILVFYVVKKLFSKEKDKKNIYAFFVAFLFGIHPLHVESVSWIAERKDVLYSLYFLLSLLAYFKYISSKKKVFYVITFILFLLSLFAKTQAVVLSLILILIDYYRLNFLSDKKKLKAFLKLKDKEQWTLFLEKIPFLVLSLVFGYIAIKASGSNEPFAESLSHHRIAVQTGYGFIESVMLVSYSLFMYIAELIIPFKQSAVHPYPFEQGTMPAYYFLFFIFTILFFSVLIWAWLKKKKLLFFSLAFFFFNIFIVLRIKNFVISEHYEYLPSIGIFVLFVYFVRELYLKHKGLRVVILILTLFYFSFLSYKTFERNKVFKDSLSFWNDVSAKYPNVIVAYYNKANYLQKIGDQKIAHDKKQASKDYLQAISNYQKAIKLNDSYIGAYSNLGITFAKLGKYKKAIDNFDKVIQLDSSYGDVYSNRGNAFALIGKWKKALNDYNQSIRLKPNFPDPLYNRGLAYLNIDKFKKAIVDFDKVLKLSPKKYEAYMQRGFCYYFLGKYEKAINDFSLYLKLYPAKYNVLYYRALSFDKKGENLKAKEDFETLKKYPQIINYILQSASNFERIADNTADKRYYDFALESLNTIFRIDKNNSVANARIGVLYGKLGNFNKTFYYFDKAILLDSTNADAFSDRGYAYFLTGKYKKSLSDYNTAIRLNPSDFITYYNRGILFEKLNISRKALDDYTKCIDLKSNYGLAYFRRALLFLKINLKNKACDDFKNAKKYRVNNADFYLQKYCNQ